MIMAGGSIMSEETWNKLSEEDKKIVEEAYEVSREFNRDRSKEKEEENLKAFKDNDGVIVDFDDEDKLLKLADEINEKYSSQNEKIKNVMEYVKQMK
jgi:TRAP-type C4-dicarboxylate transport system substrate-binding protein